jgi:hypothetical protein
LLLRSLRGEADFFHEGIISAEELGIYLSHQVPRYSQRLQTPQIGKIANASLSEGQFFFLNKSISARERRLVHYANGVVNKAQFSKFVHEKTHTGPRRADPLPDVEKVARLIDAAAMP